MPAFYTRSLMNRMVVLFLLVVLAAIAVVAYLAFHYSSQALTQSTFNELEAVNAMKKQEIVSYLKEREGDLEVLAASSDVRKAFELLLEYHDAGGGEPDGPFNVESVEYKKIYQEISPFFRKFADTYGYADIFMICRSHGHVMYTVARDPDLGTNLKMGPYRDSGLARLWSDVVKNGRPCMVDYSVYEPSKEPAAFVGAPVRNGKGEIYAVVALEIKPKEINDILQERAGMGATGESYMVGEDLLMRSDSRFSEGSSILKQKAATEGVKRAAEEHGEKIIGIMRDYRGTGGEKVLGVYQHAGLDEVLGTSFEWIIVSEMDAKEALKPVWALGWRILAVAVVLAVIAAVLAYFVARSIVRPVQELSDRVRLVADGDLTVQMASAERHDEIGVLVNAFKDMLSMLRSQAEQIITGANTPGFVDQPDYGHGHATGHGSLGNIQFGERDQHHPRGGSPDGECCLGQGQAGGRNGREGGTDIGDRQEDERGGAAGHQPDPGRDEFPCREYRQTQ